MMNTQMLWQPWCNSSTIYWTMCRIICLTLWFCLITFEFYNYFPSELCLFVINSFLSLLCFPFTSSKYFLGFESSRCYLSWTPLSGYTMLVPSNWFSEKLWLWGGDLHLNPLCFPYISIVFPTLFLSTLIKIYSSSPNIFDVKSFRLDIVSLLVIVFIETFYWFGREWRINKITSSSSIESLFPLVVLVFFSSPWKTLPFSHFLPWFFFSFHQHQFLRSKL